LDETAARETSARPTRADMISRETYISQILASTTPYTVLSVGGRSIKPNSSQADVKKSYLFLTRNCHPDKVTESIKAKAERAFKRLGEAYQFAKQPISEVPRLVPSFVAEVAPAAAGGEEEAAAAEAAAAKAAAAKAAAAEAAAAEAAASEAAAAKAAAEEEDTEEEDEEHVWASLAHTLAGERTIEDTEPFDASAARAAGTIGRDSSKRRPGGKAGMAWMGSPAFVDRVYTNLRDNARSDSRFYNWFCAQTNLHSKVSQALGTFASKLLAIPQETLVSGHAQCTFWLGRAEELYQDYDQRQQPKKFQDIPKPVFILHDFSRGGLLDMGVVYKAERNRAISDVENQGLHELYDGRIPVLHSPLYSAPGHLNKPDLKVSAACTCPVHCCVANCLLIAGDSYQVLFEEERMVLASSAYYTRGWRGVRWLCADCTESCPGSF
jgi:hypothetical protein